mmetsp:Transcript_52523/g.114555  ORF Transcript_52523/g.114555 Transcript_52523/m.114555 type:complete len:235 (-) Transcript_52523:484-1188(-)
MATAAPPCSSRSIASCCRTKAPGSWVVMALVLPLPLPLVPVLDKRLVLLRMLVWVLAAAATTCLTRLASTRCSRSWSWRRTLKTWSSTRVSRVWSWATISTRISTRRWGPWARWATCSARRRRRVARPRARWGRVRLRRPRLQGPRGRGEAARAVRRAVRRAVPRLKRVASRLRTSLETSSRRRTRSTRLGACTRETDECRRRRGGDGLLHTRKDARTHAFTHARTRMHLRMNR